jgi:enoyl-CoA hydratase/carnithine racemase
VAYKTIRVDAGEPIVVVRINRPVKNYASKQMAEEIIQFCQQAADRPPETLRAVVLTGEGPVFSCGYDIDELDSMSADAAEEFLTCTYQAIYALYKLPIPLIAAINGPAIGWGFTAAFAADILTAHPATQLSFSEATLGLLPSATFLLHRKGFSAKARELLFTANKLTGTDARGTAAVVICLLPW